MEILELYPIDFDIAMKDDPRIYWMKIRTTFGNGDTIEEDETGTALHCFYDAEEKDGIVKKEYLDFILMHD